MMMIAIIYKLAQFIFTFFSQFFSQFCLVGKKYWFFTFLMSVMYLIYCPFLFQKKGKCDHSPKITFFCRKYKKKKTASVMIKTNKFDYFKKKLKFYFQRVKLKILWSIFNFRLIYTFFEFDVHRSLMLT